MIRPTDYPFVVLVIALVVLWLAVWTGSRLRSRHVLEDELRDDFGIVLAAVMTLLGLVIGFSFSMAINRYDERKTLEEAEANAIGTEYLRADLLPTADAAVVRALLVRYLDQRIAFYTTRDTKELQTINAETARLQADLWSAVRTPALAQPTPLSVLVVSGMNDVLNSQGYTQAAWWNRIPRAAWALMTAVAVAANFLLGFIARRAESERMLLLVMPLLVGVALALIADIDSPRGGVIRVQPQNLLALAELLKGR
jgi:FtsH-binding integral membrane protein